LPEVSIKKLYTCIYEQIATAYSRSMLKQMRKVLANEELESLIQISISAPADSGAADKGKKKAVVSVENKASTEDAPET